MRERVRADPADPARVWMRRRWRPLAALALAATALATLDLWIASCGWAGCPSRAEIRSFRPPEGGRVVDRDGTLIGRLTWVRRVNVPLAQVPAEVRQAFVAVEDRRFYEHRGLDWRALGRAVARNTAALGVREGFSTITMQVARNTFANRRFPERTLRRKLMELRMARLLERDLTKDQILEIYLNVIYLGNGVYGVEAASRDLFGKGVAKTSLAEAAMLAALPKGPSAYTPRRDAERARRRRDLVLTRMVREGYISADRAAAAARQPVRVAAEEWRPARADDSFAIDAVRAIVDSVLRGRVPDLGELTVYTTLDAAAQRAADRAVRRRAAVIQREADAWGTARGDAVEGAMVALDAHTGDIRALVGGRRFERGGFNRALGAHRQPGSAFKPFVYAAALAAGLTPASLVDDEPVEVDDGGRIWTPANFGDEYQGRVTLRRALMHSSNAATVRVSRAIGEQRVVTTARRNGIASALQPVPAIALGALEVTPIELVTAYAPFANGGARVVPRLVRRIEAADGSPLWSSEIAAPQTAMDARDAYQLTSMLRSVVDRGTGRVVRELGANGLIAGKTGTTNNGADVWFVGYTPTLVAGFWFGFDTPRSISGDASGGRLAAPAWAEFYRTGWRERSAPGAWDAPEGMTMRTIDAETGELAGEWCPITQREWFKPGTEPTVPCREHEAPPDENSEWIDGLGDRIGRALKRVFRF